MITNITVQTSEGRVVGVVDSLSYTTSREMSPIYTMGTPKGPYTKRKLAIAGHLFLSKPLDSEWPTSKIALGPDTDTDTDNFNLVEPLDVTFQSDDGSRVTLSGCEFLNEGYGVSYRDLIGFTGGLTFVASGMYYGASREETTNFATNLKVPALKELTKDDFLHVLKIWETLPAISGASVCPQEEKATPLYPNNADPRDYMRKTIPTADEMVCAQPLTKPTSNFWDQVYAQEYDAKWVEEASLKVEEDPHKGMIYNPYTDKWSFL
jgi:hypothetical protein